MEKEDRETLKHISGTLDEMLEVMKKPPNRFERLLNIAAAIVTIVGIIAVIDMVIKWIGG